MKPTLSPDVQVALVALRAGMGLASSADVARLVQATEGRLNPSRFANWCSFQGIVPSVHRGLAEVEEARALRDALAALSKTIAAAGLFQARALKDVLHALAAHGIDVVPLKGVRLDVLCYGGPGRRKDGDHDLLVRPGHVKDAVRVLEELGYRSVRPDVPVSEWESLGIHHGPALVNTDGAMPSAVELHWDVAPSSESLSLHDPRALTRTWWERASPGHLLGEPMLQLRPEDEFVYLCLHLVRHLSWHGRGLSVRMAMLEDVGRFAMTADLDADVVWREADRLGDVRVLGPVQTFWEKGLGAPADVLFGHRAADLKAWPSSWWERKVVSLPLLVGDVPSPGRAEARTQRHSVKFWRVLTHLTLLTRGTDRLRLLMREIACALTVNDTDRRSARSDLPTLLLFPVRMVRLGRRLLGK